MRLERLGDTAFRFWPEGLELSDCQHRLSRYSVVLSTRMTMLKYDHDDADTSKVELHCSVLYR